MLKFKQRQETKQIYVTPKNVKDKTKEQLYKLARQQGELDTGYHIILHNNGHQEFDRDINAVAQYDFVENETSIYILADTMGKKHLSDAQKAMLSDIGALYKLPIKYTTEV